MRHSISVVWAVVAAAALMFGPDTRAAKLVSKTYVDSLPPYSWISTFEGFHTKEEAVAACVEFAAAHPDATFGQNCAPSFYIGGFQDLTLVAAHVGWNQNGQFSPFYWYNGYYCRPGLRYVPTDDYHNTSYFGTCAYVIDRYFFCDVCAWSGNPISALTGQKRQRELLGNWLGMDVELVYDNREKLPTDLSHTGFIHQPPPSFGPLWFGSHHRRLVVERNTQLVALAVHILRGSGEIIGFTYDPASGRHLPQVPSGNQLTYVLSDGSWLYRDLSRNVIERYDGGGVLRSITGADGSRTTYEYSNSLTPPDVAPEEGLLIAIRDDHGRAVAFRYERPVGAPSSRVTAVTAPDGNITAIGYDAAGRMASIQRPGAASKQFRYESAELPWALTGIVNEDGTRYATFGYDSTGRAISTEHAGGTDRFAVTWSAAPQWHVVETYDPTWGIYWRDHTWQLPEGTRVQSPNGSSETLSFILRNGAPAIATRVQTAGAGSAASTQAYAYDTRGFLSTYDDLAGSRTCYLRDAQGRELARVEGLAATPGSANCDAALSAGAALPPGASKVSTTWHPTWNLATAIAEPGRMTTLVYNGQPDPLAAGGTANCITGNPTLPDGAVPAVLCARIEQATTDDGGAAGFAAAAQAGTSMRVSRWTYNALGQVTTATEPSGAVTAYAYYGDNTADHRIGDLQLSANAMGHATVFTRYDGNGQWLESRDPNGVPASRMFDARGRLTSTTVGGLTRQFIYDTNGLLARTVEPDGTTIDQIYDAAGRLIATTNSQGQRIDYALDAAGNRVSETLSDAQGVRRQLVRSFDALNRVQSLIGREVQP